MTSVGHLLQGPHKGAAGALLLSRHRLGTPPPRGHGLLAASLFSQGQGGLETPANAGHCPPSQGSVPKGNG